MCDFTNCMTSPARGRDKTTWRKVGSISALVSVLQCTAQCSGVPCAPLWFLEVEDMVLDPGEGHGVPHQGLFYIMVTSTNFKCS